MAAESPGGAGKLVRELPLLGELPLIDVPAHSTDSDYPAIAWQPRAARIAVHRATAAAAWLRVRPALSCVMSRINTIFISRSAMSEYAERTMLFTSAYVSSTHDPGCVTRSDGVA